MKIIANISIFNWKKFKDNNEIYRYKWIYAIFIMFLK